MRTLSSTVFVAVCVAGAGCVGAGSAGDVGSEASVRPGINDSFLNPALDVDGMTQRFEAESREIFAKRAAIARAVGLGPGMAVADVGAGTGLFVELFARDVTESGRVYAVEIAPKFVELLRERAAARGFDQVEAVLGSDRDVRLPDNSTDVVFVCDTYHHYEYPRTT
jgi:tRNA A58 N-methylase Trm61